MCPYQFHFSTPYRKGKHEPFRLEIPSNLPHEFLYLNCHTKTNVSSLINFQDEMVHLLFLQKTELKDLIIDKKFIDK